MGEEGGGGGGAPSPTMALLTELNWHLHGMQKLDSIWHDNLKKYQTPCRLTEPNWHLSENEKAGTQSDEIIERAPLEGGSRAGVRRIPHRLGINRQILVIFLRGFENDIR